MKKNCIFNIMSVSLVLVHIGKNIPEYIYDCIYQVSLFNSNTIYVLLESDVIESFKKRLNRININGSNIICVPLELIEGSLEKNSEYIKYKSWISKFNNGDFRDGFWISTTKRFYYIYEFMKLFSITNLFHIENDIMMYTPFDEIYKEMDDYNRVWMIKDHPKRVIPSIMFFPHYQIFYDILKKISGQFSDTFVNDMVLFGNLSNENVYLFPNNIENGSKMIFDAAAIGQYLGGVDTRNDSSNTVGFINETSVFRADSCDYVNVKLENNLTIFAAKDKTLARSQLVKIANLHIHSKRLHQFSSEFTYKYDDIISGERLFSLCDFVICTRDTWNFHKNLQHFAKDVIIINDFTKINGEALNRFFDNLYKRTGNTIIKLGVYTHILEYFRDYVLKLLSPKFKYVLYTHNSDHPFDITYKRLVEDSRIEHIYCQNINYPEISNKLQYLPIGLGNSMWRHGDIPELYTVMSETYLYKKTKNLYININPNTFPYRKSVLEQIEHSGKFKTSTNKPYPEYLRELSEHRFVLCIRGNGISSHREQETMYLGAIPVIINNKHTKMDDHVKYLRQTGIPFYEITSESLSKYSDDFFNEELYNKYRSNFSLNQLKLSYYDKF